MFAQSYPKVRMKKDSIVCLSAESDGIITAGGGASWQDLALYLTARFRGQRPAIETARIHLLIGRASGQLPFAALNRRINTSGEVIGQCQEWAAGNFRHDNPVNAMAERAKMNVRTLSRRFRAATGQSPIGFVQILRVEEAKVMLETEHLPVDAIGFSVGHNDPSSFRRVFQPEVEVSPTVASNSRQSGRLVICNAPTLRVCLTKTDSPDRL